MDSKEFIKNVLRTEASDPKELKSRLTKGNTYREIHASMGACTEIGELVDIFKRKIFYKTPVNRTNLIEETGDVLWYLAVIADEYKFTFEEAMDVVIAKLKKRFPDKFTADNAVNRNLADEVTAMVENMRNAHYVAPKLPEYEEEEPPPPKPTRVEPEKVVHKAGETKRKRTKEELQALERIKVPGKKR